MLLPEASRSYAILTFTSDSHDVSHEQSIFTERVVHIENKIYAATTRASAEVAQPPSEIKVQRVYHTYRVSTNFTNDWLSHSAPVQESPNDRSNAPGDLSHWKDRSQPVDKRGITDGKSNQPGILAKASRLSHSEWNQNLEPLQRPNVCGDHVEMIDSNGQSTTPMFAMNKPATAQNMLQTRASGNEVQGLTGSAQNTETSKRQQLSERPFSEPESNNSLLKEELSPLPDEVESFLNILSKFKANTSQKKGVSTHVLGKVRDICSARLHGRNSERCESSMET